MFCKHLLVYINSKVPFHENLPPLPSQRSGVPDDRNEVVEHDRNKVVEHDRNDSYLGLIQTVHLN
jgi:hypothetical protein